MDHCFLGPKGEQRAFLLDMISLVLNDYIFWRKNFYPKDPPSIALKSLGASRAVEFREKFVQELTCLTSDLKIEVPFFSPRYIAHIASEQSLPGLIAYFATLLYNPNNVSTEASSVTTRYELEVGKQFAELFRFKPESSFGHLTSGGTVANYEAIWYAKTAKFLPLNVVLAMNSQKWPIPRDLKCSVWELLNLPWSRVQEVAAEFCALARDKGVEPFSLLRDHSIAHYGERAFHDAVVKTFGEGYAEPVLILPEMAHYCWRRASALFGVGRKNTLSVAVDDRGRLEVSQFRATLQSCLDSKRPILLSVAVAGNTEFGSIDPIDEIVLVRGRYEEKGLFSPLHVDAAFGGYFACLFRAGHDGGLSQEEVHKIHDAKPFEAIASCESVTIDPHKMGFVPYGAGSIVHRHGFLKDFVTEPAPYAMDVKDDDETDLHLGQHILEGSKPGAAAASVWFTHRMMPLNTDGFGALLFSLCDLAREFYRKMEALRGSSKLVELLPLFPPETNVLAFVVLPRSSRRLSAANRLTRQVYRRFGVRRVNSIQSYDYLVSHTRIGVDSPILRHPILSELQKNDEPGVEIIRMVVMNRWLAGSTHEGKHFIDDFLGLAYREAEEIVFSD